MRQKSEQWERILGGTRVYATCISTDLPSKRSVIVPPTSPVAGNSGRDSARITANLADSVRNEHRSDDGNSRSWQ
jgi:hypothetical protein